jgi:hypothetical protein
MAASVSRHHPGNSTYGRSSNGGPRRKSLVDWLNLVKGTRRSKDGIDGPDRHRCQKALETDYGSEWVSAQVNKGQSSVTKTAALSETQGLIGG